MCGIVGITNPHECPPEVFTRMVDALARRGPDARGEWRDDRVALGHRRLSILDLSDRGAQPMANEDGSIIVVYNGECYNHLELRKLLPDARWRSSSDTETLLRLFEKFGPSFIEQVNGMFALAIYDRREGKLYLYRDRLGEKPLYYYHDGERLLFASELTALYPHPHFPRRINPAGLREYFLYNYLPGIQTMLESTYQLLPGTMLEYTVAAGTLRSIKAFWSAQAALNGGRGERRSRKPLATRVDEFSALFEDAVRLRTLSDVPLGCFLSGGVDSSAVAAALTRTATGQVKTFTIGFHEADYDETPHARAVAKHLGTEHHEEVLTARDSIGLIAELPRISGQPFADPSILPTLLLSAMTRKHVTVALSGDGGDELFLGYDRYELALRVQRLFAHVPDWLRLLAARTAAQLPHYRLRMIAEGLQYSGERDLYAHVFIGWNRRFTERLVRPGVGDSHLFDRDRLHDLLKESGRLPLAARAGYTDLCHYLPDDILVKVDRASMHHSLEARAPMLDHRLVEWALSQPTKVKMKGRQQKILLKEYLYRHVPARLFERPKAGFAVPLRHWFRGPLKSMMQDLLAPAELKRHGLFDHQFVQSLISDHLSGRWNFERQLWALLVFQLWYREYMT